MFDSKLDCVTVNCLIYITEDKRQAIMDFFTNEEMTLGDMNSGVKQ